MIVNVHNTENEFEGLAEMLSLLLSGRNSSVGLQVIKHGSQSYTNIRVPESIDVYYIMDRVFKAALATAGFLFFCVK